MVIRIHEQDARQDVMGHITAERYIRRDGPEGIGAGVSAFASLGAGVDPRTVWEAHDAPEVHYVLRGRGTLLEEDETVELEPGDIVVTLPGRRHVIWASGHEPVVAVYVAMDRAPR